MTKHLPHLLSALLAGLSYVECQYFSMGICPAKLWVTENVTHCFSCSGSLDLSTTDILLDNPLLERPRQQNQHVPYWILIYCLLIATVASLKHILFWTSFHIINSD
jgi:hypothetical protein